MLSSEEQPKPKTPPFTEGLRLLSRGRKEVSELVGSDTAYSGKLHAIKNREKVLYSFLAFSPCFIIILSFSTCKYVMRCPSTLTCVLPSLTNSSTN